MDNALLSPHQFGLRAVMSVSDQLIFAYEYVSLHLDSGYAIDVLYFDYNSRYVRHLMSIIQCLLNKLSSIGISNSLLGWLNEFLLGRKMKVVVHGSSS